MHRLGPKIHYISPEPYPSRWTNTLQMAKTATALADEGLQVRFVTPRVWNRTFFQSAEKRLRILEEYYGIKARFTLRQLVTCPTSPARFEKFFHAVAAAIDARFSDCDVVYSRSIFAVLAAVAAGKPGVLESHYEVARHYPFQHFLLKIMRRFPPFLGVVTNSALTARHFVEIGFAPEHVAVIRNAYDPNDMLPVLTREEARRKTGLPQDAKIVCYTGHIQRRKGIETIVELASRTPEMTYVICGGWPKDVDEARLLADTFGARNLLFTGWLNVRDLSAYLYAADVLLVPPTLKPFQQHGNTVLPIKIYGYLAAGRVIVAPKMDDMEEVLRDGVNAILVTPDDLDEAARAVRLAVTDRELADRIGRQALESAKRFTWQARARAIRDFLERILSDTEASRPARRASANS